MSDCTRWSFQRKIDWFRSQFAQHASLPFSDVLPAQVVTSALETLGMHCYNSLYNPVTVLCLFLSQAIHPNPTLAATVESFLAWRLGQGMSPCSTDTGAYARARQRLPEALLAMLVGRMHAKRHVDFRRGRQLGRYDHVVRWRKPARPEWMSHEQMLQAIASHEIANRPNRLEPRQRKRRPKPYDLMTKPRSQAQKQEAKTR